MSQTDPRPKSITGEYHKYPDHSFDPIFRNFINSIRSPILKRQYTQSISKYYLSRHDDLNLSLTEIISKDPKIIEDEIIRHDLPQER